MVVLHTDPSPMRVDETGTIRIGPSRVTLDVLLADYRNGMTPKEIVQQMDKLDLADVHFAISYYLRHRNEVDEYLRVRREQADELQQKIESGHPDRANLKTKLLSRMAQRTGGHV